MLPISTLEVAMVARRLSLALAAGALALALGAGTASADQDVRVELGEFFFRPNTITVRAGEKVRFTGVNVGQFPHDIHIEGHGVTFEMIAGAGNVPTGQTGSGEMTFTTPGDYDMWCPVGQHRQRGMVATFRVVSAGAAPAQLPRTGGPSELLGLVGALGAACAGGGLLLRRRGGAA
jgi:plastocyanin